MNYAIILAGGTGSRAGGPLPKQFQKIGERSMLWRSVEAFFAFDPMCKIILVVHPAFLKKWDTLFGEEERSSGISGIIKVEGGASRIESVRNALRFVREEGKVFIHDAARPFVTAELIKRGNATVGKGIGAVPVIPLTDSLRHITPEGSEAVPRSEYVAVQTPQIFYSEDILNAYNSLTNSEGLTDDASVAERNGVKIELYKGDPANIKITTKIDLEKYTDRNR